MTDIAIRGEFPPSPIKGSALLVPIRSWAEMHKETELTRVEFDLFWYDNVADGIACFFRWLGEPRCTVLVVWDDAGPKHIECRKAGDQLLSDAEAAPIVAEIRGQLEARRAVDGHPSTH